MDVNLEGDHRDVARRLCHWRRLHRQAAAVGQRLWWAHIMGDLSASADAQTRDQGVEDKVVRSGAWRRSVRAARGRDKSEGDDPVSDRLAFAANAWTVVF